MRTRSGYCGGDKSNPTYQRIGDHTEAISIDYDPEVITYKELLGHFWAAHRCGRNSFSRQYLNAIFYRDKDQQKMATASLKERASELGLDQDEIKTRILPLKTFTYAEGYHQKYQLTWNRKLRRFLIKTYPSAKALADSAVATRLNAYLGSGKAPDWKLFLEELPRFGLPEELEEALQKEARRSMALSL